MPTSAATKHKGDCLRVSRIAEGCLWRLAQRMAMGEELKDPPTPQEAVAAAIAVEAIQATRGAGSVELLQSNPNKRYSFASFLVNAGCSLYEVQLIVGHSQIKVTQRYSHLSQESLLRAAECAGNVVMPASFREMLN